MGSNLMPLLAVAKELGTKTYQGVQYTFMLLAEEEEKVGFFKKMFNKIADKGEGLIIKGVGYVVLGIGTLGQQIALVCIAVGVYLIIVKQPKLLKYSFLAYLLSLFLELLGLILVK